MNKAADLTERVLETLPAGSVLGLLSPAELKEFLDFAVVKRLKRGEPLVRANDPGDSMMIVMAGTLKVSVRSSTGREVVLDYLGPGAVIGEIALFDGKPRTADVIAIDAVEVIVLQRRFVLPFLEKNPTAALRIIEMLCDKLRRTNALVSDGAAVPMGQKLARGVLRLIDEHGVREDGALSLGFRLSQVDLGNYVNLSRENVNRQLGEWERAGLVEVARGRIAIRDEEGLRRIADGET
jgi:CRP/FNR family cyclic AMP-dependent transcriptional regulator